MTDYLSCNPHYIVGEKRAEYARIAGERCADGASMRVIAEELGRSYSWIYACLVVRTFAPITQGKLTARFSDAFGQALNLKDFYALRDHVFRGLLARGSLSCST